MLLVTKGILLPEIPAGFLLGFLQSIIRKFILLLDFLTIYEYYKLTTNCRLVVFILKNIFRCNCAKFFWQSASLDRWKCIFIIISSLSPSSHKYFIVTQKSFHFFCIDIAAKKSIFKVFVAIYCRFFTKIYNMLW